jgi:chromosome segregation ATPase
MAQSEVDELIKRQNDLQQELSKLRAEYPRQVALLRSQAAEVDRRIEELAREEARARDITRLCEEDISYLEDQRATVGSVYADRVIEHRGSRYTPPEAETLIGRISETRGLYTGRLADIQAERAVLAAEKEQIEAEVAELRAEQAEFEVQYASLLREIERLKRNEELLKIRERKSCDDRHGEAMSTLNEVKAAIERARIEQEERMKAARITPRSMDYETRAKVLELQRKRQPRDESSAH